LLDLPILLVLIVFAATTIFYIMLYWRISSRCSKPHALMREDVDADEGVAKLRCALPDDYGKLKTLLEELKEMKKRAQLLLDDEGSSEGEVNSDKKNLEGD